MSDEKAKNASIKVGVVGVGRGRTFIHSARRVGMELVAVCDTWEEKLKEVGKNLDVETYTDYDRFLEHEMDAVVLANYFHEHAPFAVRALESGRHVMSECAACHTLAEGVRLARSVEKTGKIYMLAENYPYMAPNQEMQRLYRDGAVGKFLYGEGEYVHPDTARARMSRSVGINHWRNWIPATYYCTHSIAPIMFITDTRPVEVSGFIVPYDHDDPTLTKTVRRSDVAAVIMMKMDNQAVAKSLHGGLRGHQNYVRIHGNAGLMENSRVMNKNMLRVRREPFDKDEGEPVEKLYLPDFPEHHQEAVSAGHGGGDFFTNFHFAEAIRTGQQPYLNVYRAIDMSIAGVQAWRSALKDGAPVPVPDFREESVRQKYEDDQWSPDPTRETGENVPTSIRGEIEPTGEAIKFSRSVWSQQGYDED
ncbi:MAG: Gfo/Idh/MocA family protein [Candidatus Brocadiia bacterium]